ncbi:MAG: penicillin-binding protein 1A [Proteobacteria bacterium]|nr:penicillin-binding protein 1A [Pseudomonadota bacterium]
MPKQKSKSQVLKKRARRKNGGILSRILKLFGWLIILAAISAIVGFSCIYLYVSKELPKISTLKDYRPPTITTVYSDDERKIAEFYKERRIVVPLGEMPEMLIEAFIAAEDSRFFQHKGIDFLSIFRAFFKNIEAGTVVQGGSTITQQVTKSFFLTPERSYERKLKEAILAYRLDKTFSKEEILYLYLNQIYLGHGAYGIEAAAENYFGKTVKEINLAECAMLAGLPQAPSRYSPFRHPERAKQRQIYVLIRMEEEEYITNLQATEAINTPLDIKPRKNWFIEKVPYYTEHARRYVEKKYGAEMLYTGGLQIFTAVNIEIQKIGLEAVLDGLHAVDKRQGYRGPLKTIQPEDMETFSKTVQEAIDETPLEEGRVIEGVVIEVNDAEKYTLVRMGSAYGKIMFDTMKWARKPNPEVAPWEFKISKPGDALHVDDVIQVKILSKMEDEDLWVLSLEQEPAVQAALLMMEAETGYVKAMVGGKDFKDSEFNRAIQARRQPGSAFKPIVYAAALDKGYTPATVIIDSPVIFEDAERDFIWKPKNYANQFYGPTLMREAMAKSRNVVTIKILMDIGIDYVIDYARKLGITSTISRDLSIALGSSGMSLLEIVRAYSVFDNLGYLVEPIFITKILDRDGNILEENIQKKEKVIEKNTAYIMTSLLESVVKQGTGHRAKELNRPVAGKTGTTNNLHDAWFVGYTPRYVTGTWVGFDEEGPLGKGETGSRAASPIWIEFMKEILKDKPVRVFQVPEGVVFSKIDAETGLLPIPESQKTIFECFKEGTIPTEYTQKPDAINDSAQFFKLEM